MMGDFRPSRTNYSSLSSHVCSWKLDFVGLLRGCGRPNKTQDSEARAGRERAEAWREAMRQKAQQSKERTRQNRERDKAGGGSRRVSTGCGRGERSANHSAEKRLLMGPSYARLHLSL